MNKINQFGGIIYTDKMGKHWSKQQNNTNFIKELRRRVDKCKEKYTGQITSGTWGGIVESILNVDKLKNENTRY